MAVLDFLWLEVFVSITCYGNIVIQASELECRVPDDPPIDHVHTNLYTLYTLTCQKENLPYCRSKDIAFSPIQQRHTVMR